MQLFNHLTITNFDDCAILAKFSEGHVYFLSGFSIVHSVFRLKNTTRNNYVSNFANPRCSEICFTFLYPAFGNETIDYRPIL